MNDCSKMTAWILDRHINNQKDSELLQQDLPAHVIIDKPLSVTHSKYVPR